MNVFSKPVLPQENETKSENSSKNNFKRKMKVRNSVGNQHKFAQQLPKEAKRTCSSSEEDKLARSEHIEDTKIQNAVDKLSFCCTSSWVMVVYSNYSVIQAQHQKILLTQITIILSATNDLSHM